MTVEEIIYGETSSSSTGASSSSPWQSYTKSYAAAKEDAMKKELTFKVPSKIVVEDDERVYYFVEIRGTAWVGWASIKTLAGVRTRYSNASSAIAYARLIYGGKEDTEWRVVKAETVRVSHEVDKFDGGLLAEGLCKECKDAEWAMPICGLAYKQFGIVLDCNELEE